MESILHIVGGILLVSGTAFLMFGGLGLIRMPDIYNSKIGRAHV